MQGMQLEWAEILSHLHPLSPRPETSRLSELIYRTSEAGGFRSIEVRLMIDGYRPRHLRFDRVWHHSGRVYFPEPHNAGVLVVDISDRGWEAPILVVGDDDLRETLFGATAVCEVNFQMFPWRYLKAVLDSRDHVFETSIARTKEEFGGGASACPRCGKPPGDLTWVPVETADETWGRGEGRSGYVTCCMDCKIQIDFFVESELTKIEAELRASGESSQELPWSESEPVG